MISRWLFLFCLSIAFAHAKELPSPLLADFVNTRLDQTFINYMPACRSKYGGEFNHKLCDRKEYKCDWKQRFSLKVKESLKVRITENLKEYLSDRHHNFILKTDDGITTGYPTKGYYWFNNQNGLPLGAEGEFSITIQHDGQLEVIDLGRMPIEKEMEIKSYKVPETKLRITTDNSFGEYESLTLTVDGQYYLSVSGGPQEIFITPGEHDLFVRGSSGSFSKAFSLSKGNETIELTKSLLSPNVSPKTEPVGGVKSKYIEWRRGDKTRLSDNLDLFFINTNRFENEELFQKIDKVLLTGKGNKILDATDIFKFQPMYIAVKAEKYNEYEKFISENGSFEMQIDGMCELANIKPSVADYIIYESPNSKSKSLGKIRIELKPRSQDAKAYFESPNSKQTPYELSFGSERCKNGLAFFHLIREVENEFVNLGKGPWGEKGWTIVPTIDPISQDYRFAFSGLRHEFVRVTRVGPSFETVSWSSDTKQENGISDVKELWNSDSGLKFKCDYESY